MAEHLTVRPVVVPPNLHDEADIEKIAKRWYTEQRGRVVGNTVAWDDLTQQRKLMLIDDVETLLSTMKFYWKVK